VLKGVGHYDNPSLQTRGWLPWKPWTTEGKEGAIDGERQRKRVCEGDIPRVRRGT